MSYIELQTEEITPESAQMFWRSIAELGLAEVAIEVVTETATLVATSLHWRATGLGSIGVRLCMFNLMQSWGKLASSEITDAEYDVAIDKKIQTVINLFESVRPSNIRAEYSNSNSIFYSST